MRAGPPSRMSSSTHADAPMPTAPQEASPAPPGTLPEVLRPRDPDELWARVSRPAPVDPTTSHIGEALVKAGLVRAEDVKRALVAQRYTSPHRQLGEILVAAHVLSEAQLRAGLARWLGIEVVDALAMPPMPEAVAAVPRHVAERELVLPLMRRGEALVVAMSEPWDHHLLDELRFMTQLRIVPVMAAPGTLLPAIDRAYRGDAQPAAGHAEGRARSAHELVAELSSQKAPADDLTPVAADTDNVLVRFVHALIEEAIRRRASDIHIETAEAPRPVRVRLRIDGDLVPYLELPANYRYAVIARLKIMSDLDISEHRKPQDGKIDFARFGGSPMELRVVTVPTAHGLEDVVLRLLNGAKPLPLDGIGLSGPNLSALRQVMAKPYGLVLVCGPTGCGKTTTLHSVLRELNEDKRKIWTAEDPIEITQEGLRQVQVNPRTARPPTRSSRRRWPLA